MFFVYVLYSQSLDSFYKGQTADIEDRLKRHNLKLEKATSPGTPWSLIWFVEKATRSEAYILEKKLKNLSTKKLVTLLLKYKEGIVGPDALLLLKQWSGC